MSARARARRSDPATSHEIAARHERSGKAASQRKACLEAVTKCPYQTAAEYAERLGIERHIPSRRLPELREDDLVESGQPRVCRVMGTRSMVWWPAKGLKLVQGTLC